MWLEVSWPRRTRGPTGTHYKKQGRNHKNENSSGVNKTLLWVPVSARKTTLSDGRGGLGDFPDNLACIMWAITDESRHSFQYPRCLRDRPTDFLRYPKTSLACQSYNHIGLITNTIKIWPYGADVFLFPPNKYGIRLQFLESEKSLCPNWKQSSNATR